MALCSMSPLSWRKTSLKFVSSWGIHPMGVLHYSATKSIILFQLADDMQCATCGAIKVMVLHEEAIVIRASPPSAAHVRAYMAVVGGEPSRPQPPPSEGEEEVHLPTGNPSQVGELHNISKQTLGTSQMMNCISLWRISTERSCFVS